MTELSMAAGGIQHYATALSLSQPGLKTLPEIISTSALALRAKCYILFSKRACN